MMTELPGAKVFVAGHRGLVGSALVRELREQGIDPITRTRAELNLTESGSVDQFFNEAKPDFVFLAAAKVGGIAANSKQPVEFLVENLQIQNNLLLGAWKAGVKKVLFLGSSCIYPKECPQPIREEYLLSGKLEPTNEAYAIAKIAGITLCQSLSREYGSNYISAMPTNLYGPNDNYDLETSHVLPALIRKFHVAKTLRSDTVTIWGSGTPRREFLHVDDLAKGCIHLMQTYDDPAIVNIGTGYDISIAELASLVCDIVGFEGEIVYDSTKPDGTFRKVLDVSKIHSLGWKHQIELRNGISMIYNSVHKESWTS